MEFSIRDATPDDAAAIASVNLTCWRTAYRGLLPDDFLNNLSATAWTSNWADALSNPDRQADTVVAVRRRTIVGFATTGSLRAATPRPADGELQAIYLEPEHWRQGIGSQLHRVALHRLRDHGYAIARLWVLAGNDRAIRFYLQAGWRQDGATKTVTTTGDVELNELRFTYDLHPAGPS